jgi:hypothetical protein
MEKTTKTLGRDGRPPDRDSEPLPIEFEVSVLIHSLSITDLTSAN